MSSVELDDRGMIVTCPSCGQRNRLTYERLSHSARCSRCGASLRLPGEPVVIPDEPAFVGLTTRSALPVLVDFWAEWCGPCKMMAPELAKAAERAAGTWIAAKLDTEALPIVAQRVGISAIPLLVLYDRGRETAREAGARPASAIQDFVSAHIGR